EAHQERVPREGVRAAEIDAEVRAPAVHERRAALRIHGDAVHLDARALGRVEPVQGPGGVENGRELGAGGRRVAAEGDGAVAAACQTDEAAARGQGPGLRWVMDFCQSQAPSGPRRTSVIPVDGPHPAMSIPACPSMTRTMPPSPSAAAYDRPPKR